MLAGVLAFSFSLGYFILVKRSQFDLWGVDIYLRMFSHVIMIEFGTSCKMSGSCNYSVKCSIAGKGCVPSIEAIFCLILKVVNNTGFRQLMVICHISELKVQLRMQKKSYIHPFILVIQTAFAMLRACTPYVTNLPRVARLYLLILSSSLANVSWILFTWISKEWNCFPST